MRIAFVGGFAWEPRGTIRARAYPLAVELVRNGHEVTVFLPPYDNPAESGQERVLEGVRIKDLTVGRSRFSYPALLVKLVRAVEAYEPDVIHIFKPKGFAGAAGSYFLLKGFSAVAVDCDDLEGWGGWNDLKSYPWLVKVYIDWQERWMMRLAPAVTVASRVLEQRVQQARGHSRSVYYIPNCGVSAKDQAAQQVALSRSREHEREALGLPAGPLIFYSGHFEPGDDIMFFCRAAAPVAARNHAGIVFVGEGPNLPEIQDFFFHFPGVHVRFFPRLPYDQFLRVAAACDVAAFPYPDNALHRSKCSARIIDYMAVGMAVLTTAVGQNTEYILPDECGILTPAYDEAAFARGLERLLRDPDLRTRLGRNARLRITEKFSWSREPLQACLTAYEQLTKGSGANLAPLFSPVQDEQTTAH